MNDAFPFCLFTEKIFALTKSVLHWVLLKRHDIGLSTGFHIAHELGHL